MAANQESAKHADPRIVSFGQFALRLAEQKKTLATERSKLYATNEKLRLAAAHVTLAINHRERIGWKTVLPSLQSTDPALRVQAVETLALMKENGQKVEILKSLSQALKDEDAKVQQAAVTALQAISPVALQYYVKSMQLKLDLPRTEPPAPLFAKMPVRTRILVTGEAPIETTLHLLVPREKRQRRAVLVMDKPVERGPIRDQFRGILARELVRQAFALCVREELGLRTRDLVAARICFRR